MKQTQPFLGEQGSGNGLVMSEMDEIKSAFVQAASHELRTPLGIIQGYVELLHSGSLGMLSPEQQEALFVVVKRVHELRTMVERIGVLLAARSHAGVSAPFALSDVAVQAVEARRADAVQSGIDLVFDNENENEDEDEDEDELERWLVFGDPYQLEHAVTCLLDNALKFTPQGGRVEVRLSRDHDEESGEEVVRLTISDTGIGIPVEEQERIFDGFYQVDGSATRRYGGLGLGLTVAQAVAAKHRGWIEVNSQPEAGSQFTIALPVLPTNAEGDARELETQEGEESDLYNIMIVDDEEYITMILREALESLPNCRITTVADGREALALFEQQPFDLLITDYKMPHLDGMTLATHVRQLYPRTAIIMLTAYSDDTLRQRAGRLAIRYILDKPVKFSEIRRVAAEELSRAKTNDDDGRF